jgi:predicted house-cleaning noncanonical NTP pyrophosphatase (MazG superfamily)
MAVDRESREPGDERLVLSFSNEAEASERDFAIIGQKAAGLFSLPSTWVPPFAVIPSSCLRGSDASIRATLEEVLDESTWATLERTFRELSTQVIVRSSGQSEGLSRRGLLVSSATQLDRAEVIACSITVVNANRRQLAEEEHLALILQPKIGAKALGHLSNERRVSRHSTQWLWEVELPTPTNTRRIRARASEEATPSLGCRLESDLPSVLRRVASNLSSQSGRYHLEWLWDGSRIWILQCDRERTPRGTPPGSGFDYSSQPIDIDRLSAFVPETQSRRLWHKIECVRTFRACDLPVATVVVLDDPPLIEAIASGQVPEVISEDLRVLTEGPVVVRTDVGTSNDEDLLLPRTETTADPTAISSFLIGAASQLTDQGVDPNEICFIAHRFIPARAGAICRSYPNFPRVRIDAIWGLPDGLLYFPHDSFELDVDSGSILKSLRCKEIYLDYDETGTWFRKEAGYPWDWLASLTDDELRFIGYCSRTLSSHLGRGIDTMFFVGVDERTGVAPCLPWFYTTKLPKDDDRGPDHARHRVRDVVAVGSLPDVEKVRRQFAEVAVDQRPAVLFSPVGDDLRDRKLIHGVAELAKDLGLRVELDGSALSHVYYMLRSADVDVRCRLNFEASQPRREFAKLVRDLMPAQIESRRESTRVYRATTEELVVLLKLKAVEESLELRWADGDTEIEELADLLEVVRAICRARGTDFAELLAAADAKQRQRGAFDEGLMLLSTQALPVVSEQTTVARNEETERLFAEPGIDAPGAQRLIGTPPQMVGEAIEIPLVPPWPRAGPTEFLLDLSETFAVKIRYEKGHVFVEPVDRTPRAGPGQLRLEVEPEDRADRS